MARWEISNRCDISLSKIWPRSQFSRRKTTKRLTALHNRCTSVGHLDSPASRLSSSFHVVLLLAVILLSLSVLFSSIHSAGRVSSSVHQLFAVFQTIIRRPVKLKLYRSNPRQLIVFIKKNDCLSHQSKSAPKSIIYGHLF